jgi:hypothetical protein
MCTIFVEILSLHQTLSYGYFHLMKISMCTIFIEILVLRQMLFTKLFSFDEDQYVHNIVHILLLHQTLSYGYFHLMKISMCTIFIEILVLRQMLFTKLFSFDEDQYVYNIYHHAMIFLKYIIRNVTVPLHRTLADQRKIPFSEK